MVVCDTDELLFDTCACTLPKLLNQAKARFCTRNYVLSLFLVFAVPLVPSWRYGAILTNDDMTYEQREQAQQCHQTSRRDKPGDNVVLRVHHPSGVAACQTNCLSGQGMTIHLPPRFLLCFTPRRYAARIRCVKIVSDQALRC